MYNYRMSWALRQDGILGEREHGLRKYDSVNPWMNNPTAIGVNYLETAARCVESTKPVNHALAVPLLLHNGLEILKETGHLKTSKRIGMLLKRIENSLNIRGSEYNQKKFDEYRRLFEL